MNLRIQIPIYKGELSITIVEGWICVGTLPPVERDIHIQEPYTNTRTPPHLPIVHTYKLCHTMTPSRPPQVITTKGDLLHPIPCNILIYFT